MKGTARTPELGWKQIQAVSTTTKVQAIHRRARVGKKKRINGLSRSTGVSHPSAGENVSAVKARPKF